MRKVRKGEFAKKIGVSSGRISQYIRDGILNRSLLPDGMIDLELGRKEVQANRDSLKRMDYLARYDVQQRQRSMKA